MAAAAELTELHDRLNVEVKKLQEIHTARYSRSVHVYQCMCMCMWWVSQVLIRK